MTYARFRWSVVLACAVFIWGCASESPRRQSDASVGTDAAAPPADGALSDGSSTDNDGASYDPAAMPVWTERADTPIQSTEFDGNITTLTACTTATAPDDLYAAFNAFCKSAFGAEKEPNVYDLFGSELTLLEDGFWVYASERSAVIAFETNLPASSTVSYGPASNSTPSTYGSKTTAQERPFYIHVHYLPDLQPNTTYHYQLEATDERGHTVSSEALSLMTRSTTDAIAVPGELAGPPYVLDQSGKTYMLMTDIETPEGAITVKGDNITFDLNGHAITFGKGATSAVSSGIEVSGTADTAVAYQSSNLRIVNGTIMQGESTALDANADSMSFTPIVTNGPATEIAGVTVAYHGPQIWGMRLNHPDGAMNIHHNVFVDKGALITDRHGNATRTLGFQNLADAENAFEIHHNLVKRTRQNGIGGGGRMYNNEIYVDSYSTNAFAIQPLSRLGIRAGEHDHNRIFGTGFNAYGFGWAHEALKVHHNLIHFYGLMLNHRWDETWGDMSMLEGLRVTNYSPGGQVRNDLEYWANLIVIRGRGGSELRGTGFFSDTSIADLVFHDNFVKIVADDAATTQAACIVAHGYYDKTDALPVVYKDNILLSNVCNIRFGDSYGKGCNHHFLNNQIGKIGDHAAYHTVAFGGGYTTSGHRLVDSVFTGGAAADDVFWQKTGAGSFYQVEWTLTVVASPGDSIRIADSAEATVYEGVVGDDGELAIPLVEAIVHPPTWPDGGEAANVATHEAETMTPHTIYVNGTQSGTVQMDGPKRFEVGQ